MFCKLLADLSYGWDLQGEVKYTFLGKGSKEIYWVEILESQPKIGASSIFF